MGSLSYHTETGSTVKQNITDYLVKDCGITILDLAVRGSTGYAACTNPDHPEYGTFALVCLTSNRRSEYHNFNIKIVGEEMGPCESACPARILDLLTDTDVEYALAWRKECRANLVKIAEAKKVKPGTCIRLAQPLQFTDGVERDTFTFMKNSTFLAGHSLVRITRWRERAFEVVS